jgi:hypothetical protein
MQSMPVSLNVELHPGHLHRTDAYRLSAICSLTVDLNHRKLFRRLSGRLALAIGIVTILASVRT